MVLMKYLVLALYLIASIGVNADNAHENTSVHVMAPFARAMPKVVKNGAAFMVLHNIGDTQRFLVGLKSEVAEHVEIHRTQMIDGIMKMQQVKSIAMAPNSFLEFKPGDFHIMLIGLKQQLEEGRQFNLTLMFDDGSEREVSVPVRGMGAMPMNLQEHMHDKDHNHQHDHKKHHNQSQSSGG